MTTTAQTPEQHAEDLRRKVAGLEKKVTDLISESLFSDELDRLSRRECKLGGLATALAELRKRSYQWGADLEVSLAEVTAEAPSCLSDVRTETSAVADRLRPSLDETARNARVLAGDCNLANDEHRIDSLERHVAGLEKAIDEARQRVASISMRFTKSFDELERRLKQARITLDRFDERSFDLLPEESPLAAVEATWQDPPDGDEKNGLLMLTEHRLRFEQRDEVVTKRKFLIFTAEKEMIKKCWIDEPIGHLASSDDSTKGFLFKDQLLALNWDRKCRWNPKTSFEIGEGKADDVDRLVESILAGEVEADRFKSGEIPAAPIQYQWPEDCDDCGARIEPPVKGQTRVSCGYCGRTFQVQEVQ